MEPPVISITCSPAGHRGASVPTRALPGSFPAKLIVEYSCPIGAMHLAAGPKTILSFATTVQDTRRGMNRRFRGETVWSQPPTERRRPKAQRGTQNMRRSSNQRPRDQPEDQAPHMPIRPLFRSALMAIPSLNRAILAHNRTETDSRSENRSHTPLNRVCVQFLLAIYRPCNPWSYLRFSGSTSSTRRIIDQFYLPVIEQSIMDSLRTNKAVVELLLSTQEGQLRTL